MRLTKFTLTCLLISLYVITSKEFLAQKKELLEWENFDVEVFKKAKSENKYVLLNLKANWCHWCHVMDDSTYANNDVITYINEHYIPVKADQDHYQELSSRYKEYGWPATIVLNAKGEDIVKRAGYISPDLFLKLLKAIVKDPSPEKEQYNYATLVEKGSAEVVSLIKKMDEHFKNTLDLKVGGFDQSQKFVTYPSYEYALFGSSESNAKQWVDISMKGARGLSDPAFGGIYQYSTHGDWEHLHFEKLLSIQARYVHQFSFHALYFGGTDDLLIVDNILNYCREFLLRKNGLYANAQDADLIPGEHAEDYFQKNKKDRFKMGVPTVDTNTYTHNNAAMISSLCHFYAVSENENYKAEAISMMKELKKRKNDDGLYRHQSAEEGLCSLQDQIAMAKAFIELSKLQGTSDTYLKDLKVLADIIIRKFQLNNGSFKSFVGENGLQPQPLIQENIEIARVLNWLSMVTHQTVYRREAQDIFNFLVQPTVVSSIYSEPGLIMLFNELNSDPFHFVEVSNANSFELIRDAYAMAPFYSVFEYYSSDRLPQKYIQFEGLGDNVLFACTENYCSSPMYSHKEVSTFFITKYLEK